MNRWLPAEEKKARGQVMDGWLDGWMGGRREMGEDRRPGDGG